MQRMWFYIVKPWTLGQDTFSILLAEGILLKRVILFLTAL